MNRPSLVEMLRQLRNLVDTEIIDSKVKIEITAKLDKIEILLAQTPPTTIHVEQYINEVAEQAQVIGAIIQQSDIPPEVAAQLQQILTELVELQKRPVFVSCIGKELRSYRRAVAEYLSRFLAYEPVGVEKFDHTAPQSLQQSLHNIERCELFLGIYAERYTPSTKRLQSEPVISPTELELDHARTHFRRCLCFLSRPGIPDLELHPPDEPIWPKPTPWLEIPAFSKYYQRPSTFAFIRDTVKSWFTKEPSPQLRLARERYGYERTIERIRAFNERETSRHLAEVQRLYRAWEVAFANYEYQVLGQKALRKTIREAEFPIYEFGSVQELESQLDKAFRSFRYLESTGLASFDIAGRWSRWQLTEQEELLGAPLYWRPLLPSSLEMTVGASVEEPQEKSLWQLFLENEWHKQTEGLFHHIRDITLTLQSEPCVGQIDDRLFSLPQDFFHGNYEQIGVRLWKWCSELELKQQEVEDSLERFFKDATETCQNWNAALESLQDIIEDSQVLPEDLDLAQIQDLLEEVYQAKINLQSNLLASDVAEPPFTFSDESFTTVDEGEELIFELRQWYEDEKTRQQEALEHVREKKGRIWTNLRGWRASTKELTRAVTDPRYGRCLLVMGRSGSGKTHLVARLLDQSIEDGVCVLKLGPPHMVKDWESLLLQKAQLELKSIHGSPSWRSLKELDHYLGGRTVERFPQARLVVIVDELEAWIREDPKFLDGLLQFIRAHSELHTLYWVLVLSEYAYDLVVGKEDFWTEYGFCLQARCSTFVGWLSLDQLNEEAAIWKPILKSRAIQPSIVENIHHQLGLSSLQLLCMPFISWIIAELLESGVLIDELIDLNYIDFVERFWDLRLEELEEVLSDQLSIGGLQPELRRVVWFIAGKFAISLEEQFVENVLLEYIRKNDEEKTKIRLNGVAGAIVEALVSKNLMRRPYDPDLITDKGRTVDLSILPFWQYWGGCYLARLFARKRYRPDIALAAVREQFANRMAQHTDKSVSGLLEFTILHLDQHAVKNRENQWGPAAASFAQELSRYSIKEFPNVRKNIWLAAVKASPDYQLELAQWLIDESPLVFDEQEELHRYMYFLKNAKLLEEGAGLSSHLRLKALQSHYTKVEELKLERYFESLIEQIFASWIEGEEIARSIAYLYGVESFWDVEKRGTWAFDNLCSMECVNDYETTPPRI